MEESYGLGWCMAGERQRGQSLAGVGHSAHRAAAGSSRDGVLLWTAAFPLKAGASNQELARL